MNLYILFLYKPNINRHCELKNKYTLLQNNVGGNSENIVSSTGVTPNITEDDTKTQEQIKTYQKSIEKLSKEVF